MKQPSSDDPDALFMQALGFLQSGIYGPARSLLKKVITINRQQDRPVAAAYARMALARLYADEDRLDDAQKELDSASLTLEAAGEQAGCLRIAFESGALYERQNDTEAARSAYERALALSASAGDTATAHMRLGALLRDSGQGALAEEHFRAAKSVFLEAGNELGAARAVYELTTLSGADVSPAERRALLDEAHAIAETWNDGILLERIAEAQRELDV